jgi:hypothetical protein
MNSKVFIGALIGGATFFLLGWLIYGYVLAEYMKNNCNQSLMRPMDEMIWWALILSNLISGYFLALILGWTDTSGMSAGLQKGALVGFLTALAIDLGMHAMTTQYTYTSAIVVDVAASTVMWAVAGGLIGGYMAMGKKEA